MAIKIREYRTESAKLVIFGRLWHGGECEHEYSLDETQPLPASLEHVKNIAGDFSVVTEAKIIQVTRDIKEVTSELPLV